jgi:cobyrinic acid a,c-diamide synthase
VPSPRGLILAAPASGQGKTTVTLGLLRAFADRGRPIAAAKAGPDYIDPQYHRAAGGADCVNLDPWAMRPALVAKLAAAAAADADLLLVEGVMGLFDGAVEGGGSTADLAAMLGLPVVLVVDARGQGQSAAALVAGFAGHREGCRIAGVVFNRVGSARHADLLTNALSETGVPVLGAVPAAEDLFLPSRHLGLVQAGERADLPDFIGRAAAAVATHVDLDALAALACPLKHEAKEAPDLAPLGQRIAVAHDAAFSFVYPHLIEGWRRAGADIVPFSPLAGDGPAADADAVFLPGGYPQLQAGRLATNHAFLDGLQEAAGRGMTIYGECGGYMVLGRGLTDADGTRHAMAGLLPLETSFADRKLHLGYREAKATSGAPWSGTLRGHEFHYATVVEEGPAEPLLSVRRSGANEFEPSGLRVGTVMGSFVHIVDRT